MSRAEDVALVNEHIKDLEKFSEAVQSYWLKIPSNHYEERALAARVRAAHAATTLLYPDMIKACGRLADDYQRLSVDVFNLATGGNFESSPRRLDPSRAIEVHDLTAQIIHILRASRKEILSIRRMFATIAAARIDFER